MKKIIFRASGDPVNITNSREYAKEYDELRDQYLKIGASFRDATSLTKKDLQEKYGPTMIDWEGTLEEAIIKYGECIVTYDEHNHTMCIRIYDDYIE